MGLVDTNSRVALVYLLTKCPSYSQHPSAHRYLQEAVTTIGIRLDVFGLPGVNCCIEFCRHTETESSFYLVLERCAEYLENTVAHKLNQSIPGKTGEEINGELNQLESSHAVTTPDMNYESTE
jgi:hypothetical protein